LKDGWAPPKEAGARVASIWKQLKKQLSTTKKEKEAKTGERPMVRKRQIRHLLKRTQEITRRRNSLGAGGQLASQPRKERITRATLPKGRSPGARTKSKGMSDRLGGEDGWKSESSL